LLLATAQQFIMSARLTEALDLLQDVLALDPTNAQTFLCFATAYEAMGSIEESMAAFRTACELEPDNVGLVSASVFGIDRDPAATLEDGYKIRRNFNRLITRGMPPILPHTNTRDPDRVLRVGYVSGDMRNHSASKVFGTVLMKHDPRVVDVCAYATSPGEDWLTETLKGAVPHWRDVSTWSNERLYDQIRADQIDILVDLSGHTAGNRLAVFARKPAPIQVTAWGYITGTGLDTIDYMFADADTVLPGEEQWYSEEVVRLPRIVPFWPIDPTIVGPVGPLPCLKNGYLTFGVLNRIGKLKIGTIELWARILKRLPDARLIVKAPGMEDPQIRLMIQQRFERFGTTLSQLQFRGGTDAPEHQRTYHEIDVGLDPWPDGGGVSTLEALWMGVPSVTMPYRQIASRLTTSFQKELGLPWLSASSPDEYVERAVSLNDQRRELARVRSLLRDLMCVSVLCNTMTYVNVVQDAYRAMWQRWCSEQAVGHRIDSPFAQPSPTPLAAPERDEAPRMTLVGA
jgi:predicted O-linked N-acetylglucosamine transferase (SPINDLY family)